MVTLLIRLFSVAVLAFTAVVVVVVRCDATEVEVLPTGAEGVSITDMVRAATSTGEGQIIPPQSTIFITGGATGIGLEYAKRWIAAGHTVITCGRRRAVLEQGKQQVPGLLTFECDVENSVSRKAIFDRIEADFPEVNVLVNNAAVILTTEPNLEQPWELWERQFDINTLAAIHLQLMFAEKFLKRPQRKAALINVSTGAGLVPIVDISCYSASKAALHSFTLSHRIALKGSNVKVVEIFPGPVLTDILPSQYVQYAMSVDTHADRVFAELALGVQEISDSSSENVLRLSRDGIDKAAAELRGIDSIF